MAGVGFVEVSGIIGASLSEPHSYKKYCDIVMSLYNIIPLKKMTS